MSDTIDSTVNPPVKQCSKCGKSYPATTEWFYRSGESLNRQCKSCLNETKRKYLSENPEKRKETCRKYHLNHKPQQREYERQYSSQNRGKINARERERYAANIEIEREHQRQRRIANPQKAKEYKRRYKAKHPDRVRAYRKQYFLNRPNIDREHKHRRYARKHQLQANFTADQWHRCLEYFGYCCAVCDQPRGLWHTLAQDHWIPLTKGGGYTTQNIVPLCHAIKDGQDGCNNRKHNKNPHDWLVEMFGARKANQIEKRIQAYFDWVREQDKKAG